MQFSCETNALPFSGCLIMDGDNVEITASLLQLTSQSWREAELHCQTFFSSSASNRLHFSKVRFLLILGKFCLFAVSLAYHEASEELFEAAFGEVKRTASFVQFAQMTCAIFFDIISTLFLFLERDRIPKFHRNLIEFIQELNSSENNAKLQQITLQEIVGARKYLKFHQKLIFGTFWYQLLTSVGYWTVLYFNPPDKAIGYVTTWQFYSMPVFMLSWGSNTTLSLLQSFVLTNQLQLLGICATTVEATIHDKHTDIAQVLGKYRKLECLVVELNVAFGFPLAINTLWLAVSATFLVFDLIIYTSMVEAWALVASLVHFGIVVDAICIQCLAAHGFESRARRLITLMLDYVNGSHFSGGHFTQILLQVTKSFSEPLRILPAFSFELNRTTIVSVKYEKNFMDKH